MTLSRNPLVTAIIIFLNAERFLQEAIDSVFSQTYESWELLLIDDGSTDGGTTIARQCAENCPGKVIYLEHAGHENRGMSATRNLGIRNAHGEYIAFLDADDVWLPQKLEKQVNILESEPEAAMVFSPARYWYSWSGLAEDAPRDFVEEVSYQYNTLIRPPELLVWSVLRQKLRTAGTCSRMLRREVLKETGGYEDHFRGLFEDQVFLTKIYATKPVFAMSDCLDWYRQHPDSCVALSRFARKAERGSFLVWVEQYLMEQRIKDPGVWQALREAQRPYRHPRLYRLENLFMNNGLPALAARVRSWL
jgi:glycosyltransferase involved in cell wall biosynthesis